MLDLYALPTMPVEEALHDLDHCDTLSEPPVAGNNEVDILIAICECLCRSSSQTLVQQGQTFREAEVSHELVLHVRIEPGHVVDPPVVMVLHMVADGSDVHMSIMLHIPSEERRVREDLRVPWFLSACHMKATSGIQMQVEVVGRVCMQQGCTAEDRRQLCLLLCGLPKQQVLLQSSHKCFSLLRLIIP